MYSFKIWNENDNVNPIATYTLTQTPYESLFYAIDIPPLELPAGTYRISVGYKNGMLFNTTNPMSFAYPITSVEMASTPNLDGGYPTNIGLLNTYLAGLFWYDFQPIAKVVSPIIETDNLKLNGSMISLKKFMMTDPVANAINTTQEQDLLLGSGFVGSLTFKANSYDNSSYTLYLGGSISGGTLLIRIKLNNSTVIEIPVDASTLNAEIFEMNTKICFVRVNNQFIARILTAFEYASNSTPRNFKRFQSVSINSSIDSTLQLTAQWDAGDAGNSIQVFNSYMQQNY